MSMLFLGAPTQQRLRQTWKEEYKQLDFPPLSQYSGATVWRRLNVPIQPNAPAWTRESMEINDAALDTSFALYTTQDLDMTAYGNRSLVGETSHETIAATQYPDFSFDMSSVLDVEDIYHAPVVDRNGRPLYHSMLAAILSISESKQIVTKTGQQTQVVILSLGDSTANGFEMAVWGSHAQFVSLFLRRLDIILIQDFVLSTFNNVLGGTSRQGRSRFTLLYRIDRRDRKDDEYRPLLQADLQSMRVKAVRDWALTWLPSDTQPEDPSLDE